MYVAKLWSFYCTFLPLNIFLFMHPAGYQVSQQWGKWHQDIVMHNTGTWWGTPTPLITKHLENSNPTPPPLSNKKTSSGRSSITTSINFPTAAAALLSWLHSHFRRLSLFTYYLWTFLQSAQGKSCVLFFYLRVRLVGRLNCWVGIKCICSSFGFKNKVIKMNQELVFFYCENIFFPTSQKLFFFFSSWGLNNIVTLTHCIDNKKMIHLQTVHRCLGFH